MRADGSDHKSVVLPFRVLAGGRNPWIRDDGRELIVGSGDCPSNTSLRCAGGITFYRVDVGTGKATPIAATAPSQRRLEDYFVSADGKSLVYTADLETRFDFYEFDFSDMLKSARR